MSREGYITVSEAAERLGVSRQAVHNRIKAGRYRAETVITGKQEHYEIFEEDVGKDVSSGFQVDTKLESLDSPQVADLSRYLWGTLQIIEKQLEGKDQIIERLEKDIVKRDKVIERLQEAIVKLAEKQAEQRPWWRRW